MATKSMITTTSMLATLIRGRPMEEGFTHGRTVNTMRASGTMERSTDSVSGKETVRATLETGGKARQKGKELTHGRTEMSMKEIGTSA